MDELELLLDLDDRRNGERFALDVPMTADGHEAKILNLSENGIRFVTSNKVEGDSVSLVLGDGENRLYLEGKKVWSEPVGPGHSAVGVIFLDSDELDKFRQLLE